MNDKLEQQYKMVISDLCTSLEIMRGIIATKPVTDFEIKRLDYVNKVVKNCINLYSSKIDK